jgi:Ion transport protein
MGFNRTGPFVLTIYRILSKDIPYFLQFYSVVLVGFACALSMLNNLGDPYAGTGFLGLIEAIYMLIKMTVANSNVLPNFDPLDILHVPSDLQPFYDVLLTCFNVIVNLMMLNLLIGMIANTYSDLSGKGDAMLLIEKYNIMKSYEREIAWRNKNTYRRKYAIDVKKSPPIKDLDQAKKKSHYRFRPLVRFLDWYLGEL